MQIEIIGCTSAGKSTFARQIIEAGRSRGVKIEGSYDYVLNCYYLGWLHGHGLRMLVLNCLTLWACTSSVWRNWGLLRFIVQTLRTLPRTVSRSERLKIARITLRNIGIHEIVSRWCAQDQIILADEGTLQIVHYLFVHLANQPDLSQLTAYLHRAQLPELVIYYRQPEEILISRTLARGHKRIPDRSIRNVQRFIRHAVTVFDHVVCEPIVQQRTIEVDGYNHQIAYAATVNQTAVQLITTIIQDSLAQDSAFLISIGLTHPGTPTSLSATGKDAGGLLGANDAGVPRARRQS